MSSQVISQYLPGIGMMKKAFSIWLLIFYLVLGICVLIQIWPLIVKLFAMLFFVSMMLSVVIGFPYVISKYSIVGKAHSKTHQNKARTNLSNKQNLLLHGTSRKAAFEIFDTGLWLVKSKPYAVWMTDDPYIATYYADEYAKDEGAIVVLKIDKDIKLKKFTKYFNDGVYIYQIPDATPRDVYYKIEGIEPIAICDIYGTKILKGGFENV